MKRLKVVDIFVYLGNVLNTDGTLDAYIKYKIVRASVAFGKFVKQVQLDLNILIAMKSLFLQPCYRDVKCGQLTDIISN